MSKFDENIANYFEHVTLSLAERAALKKYGFTSKFEDFEGNYDKFINTLRRNAAIIKALKKANPDLQSVKTNYVFGGDLTDKGKGNVAILKAVTTLSFADPKEVGEVHFLIGNRDNNKKRFKEALSPWLLQNFSSLKTPYYYWANDKAVTEKDMNKNFAIPFSNKVILDRRVFNTDIPADWIELVSMEVQYEKDDKGQEVLDDKGNKKAIPPTGYLQKTFGKAAWNDLDSAEKVLTILQFICERTMGAPNYLADLKAELAKEHSQIRNDATLFLSAIFDIHFSPVLCQKWRNEKLLPEARIDGISSWQHDYAQKAKFGVIIGKTMFMHSLNSIFPMMQSGKLLGWTTRHSAKLNMFRAVAINALALGGFFALQGFFSLSILIAAAVAMFILSLPFLYFAYKAANTNLWSRWFDARDNEIDQAEKEYLAMNPDAHFNQTGTPESLLKIHPTTSAALPQSASKPEFQNLAISVNSTTNVMTEDFAKKEVHGRGINTISVGHQPADKYPVIRRPYFVPTTGAAVMTYEGDTGTNGLDGGVFLPTGRGFSAIPVQKNNTNILSVSSPVKPLTLDVEEPTNFNLLVIDTEKLSKLPALVLDQSVILNTQEKPVKAFVAGELVDTTQQAKPESSPAYAYSSFDVNPGYYNSVGVGGLTLFAHQKAKNGTEAKVLLEHYEMDMSAIPKTI